MVCRLPYYSGQKKESGKPKVQFLFVETLKETTDAA